MYCPVMHQLGVAGQQDKHNFLNQLDAYITSVPARDCYVILGDFNACIGSRSDGEDELWGHMDMECHGAMT